MRKRLFLGASLFALSLSSHAQKVDFDMSGRQASEVCEPGFMSWAVKQGLADTMKVSASETESFDIIIT